MVTLDCGHGRQLDLSVPRVMGILNVTPDSFSDGGFFVSTDDALRHAEQMMAAGAAIIDVGGESTRPGADDVPEENELRRVIPVIEAIARRLPVAISVDTSKPAVMREAAASGAWMINDVRALRAPGALEAARDAGLAVCLMHMQGQPRTMQDSPRYENVVEEVRLFLGSRRRACLDAGIAADRLMIDPGFGFGKGLAHNLTLLQGLPALTALDAPVLVGLSRKSMLGSITGRALDERAVASAAAALIAAQRGASMLRVHDVAETVDALKVWLAVAAVEVTPATSASRC